MYYSLTRAATWNIAGYLYLILASLIATPILLHGLGVELFARYALVVATLGLTSTFNLGLPQAVTRALSRAHNFSPRRQTLWATSSLLFVLTGLLGGTVATIVCYYLHLPYAVLPTIFLLALMSNLVAHYATLPQAEGHFGYYNAKTFIVGTANTLLAAYLAWKGEGISTILSSQLLCYLITLFVLAYFSLKFFPRPWEGKSSPSVAKSLVGFGLKNQAGTLVGQIQAQYAKYLLVSVSPLALSGYVIAQGIVQKAAGGITQVASALYPASARSNNPTLRPLYYKLQFGLIGLSLVGILVFKIWGLGFLQWWLHSPDLVSMVHSVLRVLVWYLAVIIVAPLACAVLDGRGRPELTSLMAFVTTAIEITLAIILFPSLTYMAPVYSALIAALLTTPILLYVTEKVLTSVLPQRSPAVAGRSGVKSSL